MLNNRHKVNIWHSYNASEFLSSCFNWLPCQTWLQWVEAECCHSGWQGEGSGRSLHHTQTGNRRYTLCPWRWSLRQCGDCCWELEDIKRWEISMRLTDSVLAVSVCTCLKALYATFYTLMCPKSSMFYVNISSKKNFLKRKWSQTPSVFVELSPLFTLLCQLRVPVSCGFM